MNIFVLFFLKIIEKWILLLCYCSFFEKHRTQILIFECMYKNTIYKPKLKAPHAIVILEPSIELTIEGSQVQCGKNC